MKSGFEFLLWSGRNSRLPTKGRNAHCGESPIMKIRRIEEHLVRHGFRIIRMDEGGPRDITLDMLALLLSFQFPVFQHLLRHMRGDMRRNPDFSMPLVGLSRNEAAGIKNLCHLLQRNAVLERYEVDMKQRRVGGQVAMNDRALEFLAGGWLERCIGIQVEGFLNLDRRRIELARNLCVMRPSQPDSVQRKFELDALLMVDEKLYWWEAKCGQYTRQQLLRYSAVAKELRLPPNQCLLILGKPDAGAPLGNLGSQIGFDVIRPEEVASKIEEIEERHRGLATELEPRRAAAQMERLGQTLKSGPIPVPGDSLTWGLQLP